MMMLKFRLEGWISLILLLLFSGFLYATGSYDIQVVRYPKMLLCAAIALSLAAFTQSLLRQKRNPQNEDGIQHYMSVVVVFTMVAFYAAGVIFLGFAIPTVLFLIVMMYYFGERRWPVIVAVSITFMLVLYGIFVKLLSVPLPILPNDII
jgi:hypothetical protein